MWQRPPQILVADLHKSFQLNICLLENRNLWTPSKHSSRKRDFPQNSFRPKKLIKANYKPSKMKVLKDTFHWSFKLHNYCEFKKKRKKHAPERTHIRMYT